MRVYGCVLGVYVYMGVGGCYIYIMRVYGCVLGVYVYVGVGGCY